MLFTLLPFKRQQVYQIKMAERRGRRSTSKTATAGELTWSAWAQKYAVKASGKSQLFGAEHFTDFQWALICRNKS